MLGGDLLRQRSGQLPPPGGRRPERHSEGVPDQVAAVAGLGQDKARLAAQDPEAAGEAVIGLIAVDLGVQGLQVLLVPRGLRPAEQPERDLRLTSHGSIPLTTWNLRQAPGAVHYRETARYVMIQPWQIR